MQIKLLTARISVGENGIIISQEDGALVGLNDADAVRLIESGQAERVQAVDNVQAETETPAKKRAPKASK